MSENSPTFQITSLGTKIAFLSPSTTFAFSLTILSNIGFLAAQVLRLTDVIANLVGLRNIPSFIHVADAFTPKKEFLQCPRNNATPLQFSESQRDDFIEGQLAINNELNISLICNSVTEKERGHSGNK